MMIKATQSLRFFCRRPTTLMPSPALHKLLTTPTFGSMAANQSKKPAERDNHMDKLQTNLGPATPYHHPLSPMPMTPADTPADALPSTTRGRKDSWIGLGHIKNWTPPAPTPPHNLTPDPPKPALSVIESAKRLASRMAVNNHIRPEHRVIGIGSGSTVPYVVEHIIENGGNENRWFIPTGFQSKELIVRGGLKLGDVDQFPTIDVTIDGADEVDPRLNAIKGGGACHLREKVLAEAATEFVIVADYRKNSEILGRTWRQGVPIEVAPFAYSKVLGNIKNIPGALKPVLRMGKAKAGPVVTDNGNFVIDAPFDEAHMRDPYELLGKLKMLTGVVEVGLFCGMAKAAYFGNEDGSVTTLKDDGTLETIGADGVVRDAQSGVNDSPTVSVNGVPSVVI